MGGENTLLMPVKKIISANENCAPFINIRRQSCVPFNGWAKCNCPVSHGLFFFRI